MNNSAVSLPPLDSVHSYRQKSMKPKLNSRQIGLNILGSPTAPLDGLFKPSGTQWPRPPPKEPNQNTRANSILRKKFFTYFQECHLGVQIHVEKITAICSGNITNESAKKIAWDLLVELQAILTLFLTCARKIKSCGQAPTPSSLPEASDKSPSVVSRTCRHQIEAIIDCCKLISLSFQFPPSTTWPKSYPSCYFSSRFASSR